MLQTAAQMYAEAGMAEGRLHGRAYFPVTVLCSRIMVYRLKG